MKRLIGLLLAGSLALLLFGCSRTVTVESDPPFVSTLDALFEISDYVVTGKAEGTKPGRMYKAANGEVEYAVTDMVVKVDEVLKGDLLPNAKVTVAQWGGTVGLTTYEYKGVRHLQPGKRYLLFLEQMKDGSLTLTSYLQSQYELDLGEKLYFNGSGAKSRSEEFTVPGLKERGAKLPDRSKDQ